MLEHHLEEAEHRERLNEMNFRDSTHQLNVRFRGAERKLETANRNVAQRDEKLTTFRKDLTMELEAKWKKGWPRIKQKTTQRR